MVGPTGLMPIELTWLQSSSHSWGNSCELCPFHTVTLSPDYQRICVTKFHIGYLAFWAAILGIPEAPILGLLIQLNESENMETSTKRNPHHTMSLSIFPAIYSGGGLLNLDPVTRLSVQIAQPTITIKIYLVPISRCYLKLCLNNSHREMEKYETPFRPNWITVGIGNCWNLECTTLALSQRISNHPPSAFSKVVIGNQQLKTLTFGQTARTACWP